MPNVLSHGGPRRRHHAQHVSPAPQVKLTLDKTRELLDELGKLVTNDRLARDIVGQTTVSAYRKIHEVIAGILDRGIQLARAGRLKQEEIEELLADLFQVRLLVEYQEVRGQLRGGIAGLLKQVIENTSRLITEKKDNVREALRILENARRVLDTLAVIVAKYGKKG